MTYFNSTMGTQEQGWFWVNERFPKSIERIAQNLWQAKFLIGRCLDGFPQEHLWVPLGADQSINPFGCLILHLCGSEHHWIESTLGGAELKRDKKTEFFLYPEVTVKELRQKFDERTAISLNVLQGLGEDDDARPELRGKFSVEFILHYVTQHTTFHAGQLCFTRKYFDPQFQMYQS